MRKRVGLALAMLLAVMPMSAAARAESMSASPLENKEPGKRETSVGSLVADAFRAAAHTDIAFVAAGDLKISAEPVAAGKVRSSDIAGLLAYPADRVVTLALDGRTVREALEWSVSNYPRFSVTFLQVSGVKFVFDPARPVGERVTSVTIGATPIANEQAYTVAVASSLADGALGYWKVWSKRNVVARSGSSATADAIDSYLKANPKLDYRALNRIALAK